MWESRESDTETEVPREAEMRNPQSWKRVVLDRSISICFQRPKMHTFNVYKAEKTMYRVPLTYGLSPIS